MRFWYCCLVFDMRRKQWGLVSLNTLKVILLLNEWLEIQAYKMDSAVDNSELGLLFSVVSICTKVLANGILRSDMYISTCMCIQCWHFGMHPFSILRIVLCYASVPWHAFLQIVNASLKLLGKNALSRVPADRF